MKLYFVRHGQSELNAIKAHQPPTVPLSEKGRMQAKAVAQRFKNIPIELIVSSDIVRAKQTAEAIVKATKKEVIFTELLRERRRPSILHGKPYMAEETLQIIGEIHQHRNDPHWRHSDEETFFDALKRAKEFFAMIEQRKEEEIAVVTHAAFLKFLLTYVLFGDEATPDHFQHIFETLFVDNTGISIMTRGKSIREDNVFNRWQVASWNDSAHLG